MHLSLPRLLGSLMYKATPNMKTVLTVEACSERSQAEPKHVESTGVRPITKEVRISTHWSECPAETVRKETQASRKDQLIATAMSGGRLIRWCALGSLIPDGLKNPVRHWAKARELSYPGHAASGIHSDLDESADEIVGRGSSIA